MPILLGGLLAVVAAIGLSIYMYGAGMPALITADVSSTPSTLSASVANADMGNFSENGTIILDETNGSPGVPYILYTTYDAGGKPSVKTKRLVFLDQAECQQSNLPCATPDEANPVRADTPVHVEGTIKDDTVEVSKLALL
ncbi:MAG: hypothetical protein JWN64_251 [Parcubacteria group bacterium]|nr:hypothetical protein [Parcubacteria group bacterium]